MTTAAPPHSLAQRQAALAHANEVRFARADLKRDLKARRVSASAVVLNPPEWAANMTLFNLLMATPRYGRTKVITTLSRANISQVKTLGGMTVRQRREIARLLEGRR